MTATDLSGGQGHSVKDGTDAIIRLLLADRHSDRCYRDGDGDLPW